MTKTQRSNEINAFIGERIRSLAYKAFWINANSYVTNTGAFYGKFKTTR